MITFQIPQELKEAVIAQAHIHLAVYTTGHDLVKLLTGEFDNQACYMIRWNGEDCNGEAVACGVYLLQIDAGVYHQTRQILVMR